MTWWCAAVCCAAAGLCGRRLGCSHEVGQQPAAVVDHTGSEVMQGSAGSYIMLLGCNRGPTAGQGGGPCCKARVSPRLRGPAGE